MNADIAAAHWAWDQNRPAGRGADTLPGAARLYLPLRTGSGAIGVVGLSNDRQGPLLTPEQQRLFTALADQAALAIERIQLVSDVEKAKLTAETDHLRTALLTSISHDLKTPLAAIMGSAGTLKDFADDIPVDARNDLLSTIIEESERLNRFISNLLDMTRIGSGAMEPNYGLHFVGDIVGTALARAAKITGGHRMDLAIPSDLPMLKVDPVLFEQVLFNLVDNAAKYSPATTPIGIRAWLQSGSVFLSVSDEGPGIPPDDLERIFDSFYRVRKTDHVHAGTGLGLSICRGFVEAMGGSARPCGGPRRFRLCLEIRNDQLNRPHSDRRRRTTDPQAAACRIVDAGLRRQRSDECQGGNAAPRRGQAGPGDPRPRPA